MDTNKIEISIPNHVYEWLKNYCLEHDINVSSLITPYLLDLMEKDYYWELSLNKDDNFNCAKQRFRRSCKQCGSFVGDINLTQNCHFCGCDYKPRKQSFVQRAEKQGRDRAKRKGLKAEKVSEDDLMQKLKSQNNLCCFCGNKFTVIDPPTLDHLIPLSNGGTHTLNNLGFSCSGCNSCNKGNRRID